MKALAVLLIAVSLSAASAAEAVLTVVQVLDKGVLATGYIEAESGELQKVPDVVLLYCDPTGMVDGQKMQTKVSPSGTYQYQAVTGAQKTIRAFKLEE